MEFMEKPPIQNKAIIRLILGIALCVIGLFLLWRGYQDGTRYLYVKDNLLTLTAECYRVEVDDFGDSTSYDVYVLYSYDGKEYSHRYDSFSTRAKAEAMLGKIVEIQVNAQNPDEFPLDIKNSAFFRILFSAILLFFGMPMFFARKRMSYYQAHSMRDCLDKDLNIELVEKCGSWIAPLILGLAYSGLYVVLREGYPYLWIMPALLLVIAALSLRNWLHQLRMVRNGAYRLTQQTLVDKKIKDNDDSVTYLLVYSDSEVQWERSVPRKRYNAAEIGETVDAVFLEGNKKPFFVCDRKVLD